jgi:hypothetical protein
MGLLPMVLVIATVVQAGPQFPGSAPGVAKTAIGARSCSLENQALSARWSIAGGKFKAIGVRDKLNGQSLSLSGQPFQIFLTDGACYSAGDMELEGKPEATEVEPHAASARLADRVGGRGLELKLRTKDGRLEVRWHALLHHEANYLREEMEATALTTDLPISKIVWFDEVVPAAASAGSVDGSPVVAGNFFFGFEDPMSVNAVVGAGLAPRVICQQERHGVLQRGQSLFSSFVLGAAPAGQMRRAFLYYVEQERAHPYRPFLHYNSWYDISWDPFSLNETNCLGAIRALGESFIKPYGIAMDSVVFDDGWDDPASLWRFHAGFPNGFAPLDQLCASYQTRLGVWLSPFGGYGASKERRLQFGRARGYETNAAGFSLAGPKYYDAFKRACLDMIRNYRVNYFKFDGIASGSYASGPGAEFVLDTEALRRLMLELRQAEPDLFINFTTGSWPSPFWLRYADSLWRQGDDTGFSGKGSRQQQWLTYRDSEV